jgi:hypothetical protein
MTKLISECISSDTFNSGFGYKIVVRNETSRTQIDKPELIAIKELKENGIILEMPSNSCQKSHNLSLFFLNPETLPAKIKIPDTGRYKEAVMEVITKVEHIEVNENKKNTIYVEMTFSQIDIKRWKKIMELYHANQEKIDGMLLNQFRRREEG